MYALKEIQMSEIHDDDAKSMVSDDFEEAETEKGEKISKEVMILKYLDHPNIIRYFTSFMDTEAIYIVMELHRGQSLADFISSQNEKKQKVKEEHVWKIIS